MSSPTVAIRKGIRDRHIHDESDVQNYLAQFLEVAGFLAETEVCDRTGKHRADIIVIDDDFSAGIEVKKWEGTRSGKDLSDTLRQIYRYIGKNFLNEKINLWALALYVENRNKLEPNQNYIRNIANGMGIGFINIQQKAHLYAEFQYGDDSAKLYFGEQPNDCILKRQGRKYARTYDPCYVRKLVNDRVTHIDLESEGKKEEKL